MSADNSILRGTLAAQARFFRKCEAAGLTFKALHYDTGIPLATLQSWAKETMMPLAALNRFAKAGVSDALLSILTEPGGKVVAEDDAGGCLDALGREAADYVSDWAAAKHPDSESGSEIGPNEAVKLGRKAVALRAVAGVR
jgi:hypothetical protein